MRIIAGKAKGRQLITPPGFHTRPTAARVREALFSVILPRLAGARVLDAFAGSGALGLEALSRGADSALFIEKNAAAIKALRRNIENCRFTGAKMFFGDALHFLYHTKQHYDIIFLDPPYRQGLLIKAIAAILVGGVLESGGLIVAETTIKEEFCPPAELSLLKRSVYGDTALYYLVAVGQEDKKIAVETVEGE